MEGLERFTRCGRPGCHYEKEPIHPVTKISQWEKGKLRNKIVRVADKEWVKNLFDNYKKNKKALSNLLKQNKKEREIIKTVIKSKTVKYE